MTLTGGEMITRMLMAEGVSRRLSTTSVDAAAKSKASAALAAARREAAKLRYRAALEQLNAAEQALGPP